ncbi:hypothetical protein [Sphingomonas flavalba]|uniref:hypothetical protein n=1 Tax=Sphingomonas flavalba TaxID=2559804 RepID=UPI001EF00C96|nr:hypothetical protein [Sphingomonas flavalba]
MRTAMAIALLALTAACGSRGELKPAEGHAPPPKPAFATAAPTPSEMMAPSSQAMPTRNDELLTRSQERSNDRFSQPPRN